MFLYHNRQFWDTDEYILCAICKAAKNRKSKRVEERLEKAQDHEAWDFGTDPLSAWGLMCVDRMIDG